MSGENRGEVKLWRVGGDDGEGDDHADDDGEGGSRRDWGLKKESAGMDTRNCKSRLERRNHDRMI